MLFRKLFHMLVLGGAVVGTTSGCATTSATNADGSPAPKQQSVANPGSALPGGGGVRGW
jgi:hypothetical protein